MVFEFLHYENSVAMKMGKLVIELRGELLSKALAAEGGELPLAVRKNLGKL